MGCSILEQCKRCVARCMSLRVVKYCQSVLVCGRCELAKNRALGLSDGHWVLRVGVDLMHSRVPSLACDASPGDWS